MIGSKTASPKRSKCETTSRFFRFLSTISYLHYSWEIYTKTSVIILWRSKCVLLKTLSWRIYQAERGKSSETQSSTGRASQLNHGRPRRFFFSIFDTIAGQFNYQLQVDVVSRIDGNVLPIVDMWTAFHNEAFIWKMSSHSAWKILRRFWIGLYSGAYDYIITDGRTSLKSSEFK